jgi:hypothetical protein
MRARVKCLHGPTRRIHKPAPPPENKPYMTENVHGLVCSLLPVRLIARLHGLAAAGALRAIHLHPLSRAGCALVHRALAALHTTRLYLRPTLLRWLRHGSGRRTTLLPRWRHLGLHHVALRRTARLRTCRSAPSRLRHGRPAHLLRATWRHSALRRHPATTAPVSCHLGLHGRHTALWAATALSHKLGVRLGRHLSTSS